MRWGNGMTGLVSGGGGVAPPSVATEQVVTGSQWRSRRLCREIRRQVAGTAGSATVLSTRTTASGGRCAGRLPWRSGSPAPCC